MKKLPEISFTEWIEAEKTLGQINAEPKPKDSVTTREYALATNRSESRSRDILKRMARAGLAEKIRWHNGSGPVNVYRLKSNGKKPIH